MIAADAEETTGKDKGEAMQVIKVSTNEAKIRIEGDEIYLTFRMTGKTREYWQNLHCVSVEGVTEIKAVSGHLMRKAKCMAIAAIDEKRKRAERDERQFTLNF